MKATNPAQTCRYIPPPADKERDALLIIYRKCPSAEKRTASAQLAAHMRQTYWEAAD